MADCYRSAGLVLLLAVLGGCSVVLAGRRQRLEDLHPTDVLGPARPGGLGSGGEQSTQQWASGPSTPGATQETITARTQELMDRLEAQGADTNKASVRFILELYERLERGEKLPIASSTAGPEGSAIGTTGADTIKGLSPTVPRHFSHRPELALRFPVSDVVDYKGPELAELRIRPLERHPVTRGGDGRGDGRTVPRLARRGNLQRVRIRVLDSEGTRQVERVYQVKWRRDTGDGYTVLDITRVLRDMAKSGIERFQNGSLEIALKQTRRPMRHGQQQQKQRRPRSASILFGSPIVQSKRSDDALDATSAVPAGLVADDILLVVYTRSGEEFFDDKFKPVLPPTEPSRPEHHFRRSRHKLHTAFRIGANSTTYKERIRPKRHALAPSTTTTKSPAKKRCSVADMYIDFDTLGWADDIVFPVRYNAHTCSGKCPSPVSHELHPTNHAILQSMMRMHDRKTRRPCCVPVTLKPLMMLYHKDKDKLQNSGNIEIRTHPDMIVEECGCR